MYETSAACVDTATEEGHAERFGVRDALQGANDVGPLEILETISSANDLFPKN